MATTKLISAEDLIQLEDDGFQYELIRGALIRMTPAGGEHGWMGVEAAGLIRDYARPRDLGEVFGADTGFIFALDPDTVLAPDVAFVRTARLPPPDQWAGYLHVAPDLVIEIVSPSDRRSHIEEKIQLYFAARVRLLWLVEPRRRIVRVYHAGQAPEEVSDAGYLDGEDILPGLRLPVAALFRRLPPRH